MHNVSKMFLARVVAMGRANDSTSEAHFTVDGSKIGAWGSLKSFQPQDARKIPYDGDPGNLGADFQGRRRNNATRWSTTDPLAQLARRGNGREARRSFGLQVLKVNRIGSSALAMVSTAPGTS